MDGVELFRNVSVALPRRAWISGTCWSPIQGQALINPVKSTLTCSASVDPFLVSCLEYVLALATTISAHRDFCHARELSYYWLEWRRRCCLPSNGFAMLQPVSGEGTTHREVYMSSCCCCFYGFCISSNICTLDSTTTLTLYHYTTLHTYHKPSIWRLQTSSPAFSSLLPLPLQHQLIIHHLEE